MGTVAPCQERPFRVPGPANKNRSMVGPLRPVDIWIVLVIAAKGSAGELSSLTRRVGQEPPQALWPMGAAVDMTAA
jgi:hypothetical protein